MSSLKKKLFFIIVSIISIAMLVIFCYSMQNVRLNEKIGSQSHWYDLQVSMRFMEDFMEDIENMLLVDTQEDENLDKIIRGINNMDFHLSLIRKKQEFGKEIRKYQFLDGMFLYDSKNKAYVSEVGDYVTFDMYSSLRGNIAYMVQYFEKGKVKNEWTAIEIEGQFYLIRMIKKKTVYVCAWMKPEHLVQGFQGSESGDAYYLLCDSQQQILTPIEGLGQSDIDGEEGDYVLLDQVRYKVYGYDSTLRDLSLKVLVRYNRRQEILWYVVVPVLIIICMGGFILLAVWRLVKEVIFDPIDHMILKRTLERNQAKLQFLQLQVNPHFLNNCLSLVRNLILFGQYEEAENAVLALSDYTRASLQPDIMVTVGKEVAQIRSWYELQKLRLKNRIKVDIQLDDGVEGEELPTMLIHTFVENAAKHFGRKDGRVEIHVGVRYLQMGGQGKGIEIVVTDNGAGFSEDVLFKLRQGKEIIDRNGMKHVGIASIMKRLHILYEGASGIEFGNLDTGGARVRIVLYAYSRGLPPSIGGAK